MYAMLLYPGILKKVQEEIDSVMDPGRLPEPSDRQNLPYVESAWKESLRWHVSVPLGTHTYSTKSWLDTEAMGSYSARVGRGR